MRKFLIVVIIAAIIVLSSCRAAYTAPQLYSPVENPAWAEVGTDWRVIGNRLEEHGYEVFQQFKTESYFSPRVPPHDTNSITLFLEPVHLHCTVLKMPSFSIIKSYH